MGRVIDKWTLTASSVISLGLLLGCDHKADEPPPAASLAALERAAGAASAAAAQAAAAASAAAAAQAAAAAAQAAAPAASLNPPAAAAALGEAKRFPDKEKAATGTVKVALESKVYNEPDTKQPPVVTLSKDLVVTRLATLGSDWALVEFPSGIGKVSPGWIETKSLVASAPSVKPATSASAKPSASAVASTAPPPAPSASVATKVKITPGAVLRPPK